MTIVRSGNATSPDLDQYADRLGSYGTRVIIQENQVQPKKYIHMYNNKVLKNYKKLDFFAKCKVIALCLYEILKNGDVL